MTIVLITTIVILTINSLYLFYRKMDLETKLEMAHIDNEILQDYLDWDKKLKKMSMM